MAEMEPKKSSEGFFSCYFLFPNDVRVRQAINAVDWFATIAFLNTVL